VLKLLSAVSAVPTWFQTASRDRDEEVSPSRPRRQPSRHPGSRARYRVGVIVNADNLFIQSLEDLHYSLASADEYEVLRSSHLIRQLLLDGGNSLVERVNRSHRLRIEYAVARVHLPAAGDVATWVAGDAMSPLDPSLAQPNLLRWDQLQKLIVARCEGHEFTVHDLIDYSAHVAGGVHKTDPRDERQAALARLQANESRGGLSPVAATVRAIGQVILLGLDELKDQVLGVARFEDGPGLSFYSNLILAPMDGGEENYLFDIGTDVSANRVTVFLDAHSDLCVRVYDSNRMQHLLRAGPAGGPYRYREPFSLSCEIGYNLNDLLVYVDAPGWSLARVFRGSRGPAVEDNTCHLVVASDVTGRCRGRMRMLEQFIVSKVPSNENRLGSRGYLARRLTERYDAGLEFRPGACMHTIGHPNFPPLATRPGAKALVAPSDERRPILRKPPLPWSD